MKLLKLAENSNIENILYRLMKAKDEPKSHDFLTGFPWQSIIWYWAEISTSDLAKIHIFWDGSAWGEQNSLHPRNLQKGTKDFQILQQDALKPDPVHFMKVLQHRLSFVNDRHEVTANELMILGGQSIDMPSIILDGNHRAIAALWSEDFTGKATGYLKNAWVGVSPEIKNSYPKYQLLLRD